MKSKRNNKKLNCKICGHFFWVRPYRVRNNTAKTCSPECQLKLVHRLNNKNIKITCSNCGQIKKIHPNRLKMPYGSQKFCNKKCMGEYRFAEKNPNWKDGKSFKPYTAEFNSLLKFRIRKRDDFTCQICGVKENGKSHCVHHSDYDKQNCDDKNLLTLCRKCNSIVNGNRAFWMEILHA